MTYHGQVKNGVVVLEGNPLRDGTLVRVEPVNGDSGGPPPGSAEAITRAVESGGRWQGSDEEMDRLLDDLKAMKQAELRAQIEADQRNDNGLT